MNASSFAELVTLAALWGGSFLFMRMGAGEFGAVPLAALRVTGAAMFLWPLLQARGQVAVMRAHWRPIFVVGVVNSALPFVLYSYAALSITAGLSSIFNAATPLFGAVIAWVWLKDRLTPTRIAGLAIGFGGVLWLAWDKASFRPGGSGWAVAGCLAATVCYGVSAAYTKKRLSGVPPLALATGSQLAAALVLAGPALLWRPAILPTPAAWLAAGLLALACTGIAYVLYFRLIAQIGPANAISVTFLIPVFGVLWGMWFLDEQVTLPMAAGCAVILLGTALTTGILKPRRRHAARA
jgi:drug/metabolite transporter (DMT)-like permease